MSQNGWITVWIALAIVGIVGVAATGSYLTERSRRIDLQEPIVETCVHHRVSQHVVIEH